MNPDETFEVTFTYRITLKAKDSVDAEYKATNEFNYTHPTAEEFNIDTKLFDYNLTEK